MVVGASRPLPRSQQTENARLSIDTYNGQSCSMHAACRVEGLARRGHKLLIVGEMLELGPGTQKKQVTSNWERASRPPVRTAAGIGDNAAQFRRAPLAAGMRPHRLPSCHELDLCSR